MKYLKVDFHIDVAEELLQDARDVLSAMAGEAGFETFEDTPEGVTGYVQPSLLDRELLDALLDGFPLPSSISYVTTEAEQRNWNEEWEKGGFDPIVVGQDIVVHDGRHTGDVDIDKYRYAIEIDTRMAFGTGTHETTRMMLKALAEAKPEGLTVLDCGCGTGILAIAALKMGARAATGYDIDEWSTDNTRHNAVINGVDDRLQVCLGDAKVLEHLAERFDIVMANINRNILLTDMPAFRRMMMPGGRLLLSGFYAADIDLLTEKAGTLGLTLKGQLAVNEWACLVLAEKQA